MSICFPTAHFGDGEAGLSPALRNTGIRVLGDMPWGMHSCVFYQSNEDLLDTVIDYFRAGLDSNEFCLWVVSDCVSFGCSFGKLLTADELSAAASNRFTSLMGIAKFRFSPPLSPALVIPITSPAMLNNGPPLLP